MRLGCWRTGHVGKIRIRRRICIFCIFGIFGIFGRRINSKRKFITDLAGVVWRLVVGTAHKGCDAAEECCDVAHCLALCTARVNSEVYHPHRPQRWATTLRAAPWQGYSGTTLQIGKRRRPALDSEGLSDGSRGPSESAQPRGHVLRRSRKDATLRHHRKGSDQ